MKSKKTKLFDFVKSKHFRVNHDTYHGLYLNESYIKCFLALAPTGA